MSTVTNKATPPGKDPMDMRVSPYDRVSTWLIVFLIFAGFFDALMFLTWLTTVLVFAPKEVQVSLVENIAGRGDHAKGYERDVEAPGEEELEEETLPEVEQMLEAVSDVVSNTAASFDNMTTDAVTSNKGVGVGDSRPPGPLGEGIDAIPRWERWEIKYDTTGKDAYARQLDFFKIELGAVGGGHPLVDYALGFSKGLTKRQGKGSDEKRLYFTPKSAAMRRLDQGLLQGAGIAVRGRIVAQFYPQKVEDQLAVIEMLKATGKRDITKLSKAEHTATLARLRKTVFGVRRRGSGYEYYVISVAFRSR